MISHQLHNTPCQLDVALRDAPIYEKSGKNFIDYKAFVNLICAGNKEEGQDGEAPAAE